MELAETPENTRREPNNDSGSSISFAEFVDSIERACRQSATSKPETVDKTQNNDKTDVTKPADKVQPNHTLTKVLDNFQSVEQVKILYKQISLMKSFLLEKDGKSKALNIHIENDREQSLPLPEQKDNQRRRRLINPKVEPIKVDTQIDLQIQANNESIEAKVERGFETAYLLFPNLSKDKDPHAATINKIEIHKDGIKVWLDAERPIAGDKRPHVQKSIWISNEELQKQSKDNDMFKGLLNDPKGFDQLLIMLKEIASSDDFDRISVSRLPDNSRKWEIIGNKQRDIEVKQETMGMSLKTIQLSENISGILQEEKDGFKITDINGLKVIVELPLVGETPIKIIGGTLSDNKEGKAVINLNMVAEDNPKQKIPTVSITLEQLRDQLQKQNQAFSKPNKDN